MLNIVRYAHTKYLQAGWMLNTLVVKHSHLCLAVIGILLLTHGLADIAEAQSGFHEANFNDQWIRQAVIRLFMLIEGAFGALIMVVAGLGAIVAAAMGAYRAAVGMLVVAVGAFILRSLVSLFFGQFEDNVIQPANAG
jgi:hypothetical protein